MKLNFTDEIIASPEGVACKVLDQSAVNFKNAQHGRKSAETLVRCAAGGELLETKNKEGKVESVYTTKPGDAIFINLHNLDDQYVPGNPDGTRMKFGDLNKKGYMIVGDDTENGGVRIKSAQSFKVLPNAVEEPVCIKDAWGPGGHQFLFEGAALKLNDNGSVTGIDKNAFENTWEILAPSKPSAIASAAAPIARPA